MHIATVNKTKVALIPSVIPSEARALRSGWVCGARNLLLVVQGFVRRFIGHLPQAGMRSNPADLCRSTFSDRTQASASHGFFPAIAVCLFGKDAVARGCPTSAR